MKPQQLASLVSWSPPWTSRILEERNEKTGPVAGQAKVTASPAQHPPDNKSGSKKVVTWDELVSSEHFPEVRIEKYFLRFTSGSFSHSRRNLQREMDLPGFVVQPGMRARGTNRLQTSGQKEKKKALQHFLRMAGTHVTLHLQCMTCRIVSEILKAALK